MSCVLPQECCTIVEPLPDLINHWTCTQMIVGWKYSACYFYTAAGVYVDLSLVYYYYGYNVQCCVFVLELMLIRPTAACPPLLPPWTLISGGTFEKANLGL